MLRSIEYAEALMKACKFALLDKKLLLSTFLSLTLQRAAQMADRAESSTVRWWKNQTIRSAKMVCSCMGVAGAHAAASGIMLQDPQHMQPNGQGREHFPV